MILLILHNKVPTKLKVLEDKKCTKNCKKITTVHYMFHKQQHTTSCDVTILCVLLCDGRSRDNQVK